MWELTFKMKNTTMFGLGILILLIIGGFFIFNNSSNVTGNTVDNSNSVDAQKITLSLRDYNYYPNTITVKSGQPVEITLDKSISGCFRSFTIKDLGVAKNSRSPEDKIVFTPTKKGTFRFACSMGMGTGTIIVE